ncbi:hypothetical protein STRDD11_02741 [Streptococcus sp. DD11]|nr:hypothetical protein STRDD11_02741 [Streptococcus sp. DD11]
MLPLVTFSDFIVALWPGKGKKKPAAFSVFVFTERIDLCYKVFQTDENISFFQNFLTVENKSLLWLFISAKKGKIE